MLPLRNANRSRIRPAHQNKASRHPRSSYPAVPGTPTHSENPPPAASAKLRPAREENPAPPDYVDSTLALALHSGAHKAEPQKRAYCSAPADHLPAAPQEIREKADPAIFLLVDPNAAAATRRGPPAAPAQCIRPATHSQTPRPASEDYRFAHPSESISVPSSLDNRKIREYFGQLIVVRLPRRAVTWRRRVVPKQQRTLTTSD